MATERLLAGVTGGGWAEVPNPARQSEGSGMVVTATGD